MRVGARSARRVKQHESAATWDEVGCNQSLPSVSNLLVMLSMNVLLYGTQCALGSVTAKHKQNEHLSEMSEQLTRHVGERKRVQIVHTPPQDDAERSEHATN